MDKKVTGIVAYITWVGLLIALIIGAPEAKFHKNQALVLWIVGTVVGAILGVLAKIAGFFGIIAAVWGVVVLILAILGIVSAVNDEEKPLPVIGGIKILK